MRRILFLLATAGFCAGAFGDTITTNLNGLEIGIDETHGGIVRLAYADVGTILDSSADSAGLLDVAYPIQQFVPLRLASRFSQAHIKKDGDGGITIDWSPLGPSRTNFPMPKGNVEAQAKIRAAADHRSVILTCRIENKSDALVPQILFPDLRGLKAIDGPAATQLRFAAKAVYPFTEDPIPPDTAPWYVNSGWKEYPPAYGMYGINALRWLDFGGFTGGVSIFQKAWGAAERPIVRTHRSQADPASLRLVWDYKAGVKPGATWQSDEIWLTPHRGGWAKGIEVYRDYVRTKHPQRQPPPHIRDGLGMQTAWLIQTPETDPAYAAFKFKDIPRIATDAKAHGIDELNLWGWCEYFDLPIRTRKELGTSDEFVDAIKHARDIGVHVAPFVSICNLQNKSAPRYGGKPGGPAWVYHPDNVPLMDPYYLAADYPIQYWNIFTPDRHNKTFHEDVVATFKEWMERGVTSWSWDQVFADTPGSGGLTDLLLDVRKMLRAKDRDAAFSGEQLVNLEFDAGALDYTWNWQDYVDAAPITNVFRTPRLNCNIEDSPRVVKIAFADNLWLNAFPRKPDQPNGTALISEKPALAAALKQVAALRKQFLSYFADGTLIGDSVLSAPCPAFVRGYQLNDKLLVIVLNDRAEPRSLSIASELDLWLGAAAKYTVRRFDSAGKLLDTTDQSASHWKASVSELPPLDLAIFEIVRDEKGGGGGGGGAGAQVNCTPNTKLIQAYEVFELTFAHENHYANPFFDATLDVTLTSPSGKKIMVGGFHYGSLEKPKVRVTKPTTRDWHQRTVFYDFNTSNIWKARFAPNEIGRWSFSWTFRDDKAEQGSGTGEFTCVRGRKPNPGFVRHDPNDSFLWVFDDGSPYFPIGLQDCMRDEYGLGTFLAGLALEGPFRLPRRPGSPPLPPGAMFAPGPSMNPQNGDVYFRRYSRCGFNLFRFSQVNCSPPLNENFDRYLPQEAIMTDEALLMARKYRMRIMYGILGFQPAFNKEPDNAAAMEKVKRFVKYSVDRWGAYTDIWEILNEQNADDRWYHVIAPYLKSIDPYHHPVATSWERPKLDDIDVCSPHWYAGRDQQPDKAAVRLAAEWKKSGKPVIVSEQGNVAERNPASRPAEVGGCWDPQSAARMRIRNWTALFSQISLVFWNTSGNKDGWYMNLWLGPHEREYVRAMQDFAYSLGGGMKPIEVKLSEDGFARALGLASDRRAGVYLHRLADDSKSHEKRSITLDVPHAGKAYWYATETATIVREVDIAAGKQTLAVPDFGIDLALLITPDGCPDIDKDGIPNDVDPDNDNDGVPNAKDAFPLEPEEWADVDHDGIGDNLDADKNGDGVGDDDNHNGIPDNEEMDLDGDGIPRAAAVPWDAFPLDPKEWRDTDGDGIGDNADDDIDGDGFTNDQERKAGTDPYSKLSFPAE